MNNLIDKNQWHQWPELDEGDPLADAVINDWLNATPQEKALLMQGMQEGARSIPHAPDSYQSFLFEAEDFLRSAPPLDLAQLPYKYVGPMWMSVSMGPGALLHTYTDPQIAKVLIHTGKLMSQAASKRLSETQYWLLKLLQHNAWQMGGSGFIHCLQVRLIHAKVRASIRKARGGSIDFQPIPQRLMLRTWLDFAVVSPRALERLGLEWTDEEKSVVATLWHIVGLLLGIPTRVMSELAKPGFATEWLNHFNQEMPHPDDQARVLTLSMLEAIGQRMSLVMKLPNNVAIALMHGFARHIHGDALADAIGATDTSLSALIPTYVDANRYHMQKIRQDAAFRQTVIERSTKQMDSICSQIEGTAAYQHI